MGAATENTTPFSIHHTPNYATTSATPINGNKPLLNCTEITKPEAKPQYKKTSKAAKIVQSGYGGHFRAVQGFKYLGQITEKTIEDNKNEAKV